jgi:hypothetical protein
MSDSRFKTSRSGAGVRVALQALFLMSLLASPALAQRAPPMPNYPYPQPIGQRAGDSINGIPPGDPSEHDERLRALNRERQKAMISDTNKLLKLVSEFDSEVRSANLDTLTPAQLRKLAQIEKLAHNVKDKMSYLLPGKPGAPPLPTMIQ